MDGQKLWEFLSGVGGGQGEEGRRRSRQGRQKGEGSLFISIGTVVHTSIVQHGGVMSEDGCLGNFTIMNGYLYAAKILTAFMLCALSRHCLLEHICNIPIPGKNKR